MQPVFKAPADAMGVCAMQEQNGTAGGGSVSSFLAIPADTAYRNPQQALGLIAASASDAVAQVRLTSCFSEQ